MAGQEVYLIVLNEAVGFSSPPNSTDLDFDTKQPSESGYNCVYHGIKIPPHYGVNKYLNRQASCRRASASPVCAGGH